MINLLVLFLDGLGLGLKDPERNPLALASMPTISKLLEGKPLVLDSAPFEGELASLQAWDAGLGIPGLPQSASGQAVLLTGRNVPEEIGAHYGPKPNPAIRNILESDNIFTQVLRLGGTATLLNAYPPGYFSAIESRLRLYSAIPMAVAAAGIPLRTFEDLQAGAAISADFTGEGWNARSDFPHAPEYTPQEAGRLLAKLGQAYTLSWFDYWLSDYAGHRGTNEEAAELLETLDSVIAGLLDHWDLGKDLLVLTSDHGNVEDMSEKRHTRNPVPALVVGPARLRRAFTDRPKNLTSFYPAVLEVLFGGG
jgi:2,3-bisphosphoglycerate-independent phosphoglycerate mutase